MIHATELRIGNWVNTPNENQNPFKVDYFDETTVYQNSGFYKTNFGMVLNHPLTWNIKDISPIPLSPEILEKCGWGKSDEHEMGMNTLNENNDGLYYDYHFKRFRMDFGQDDNIRMPHIQYLHQLQNLIHALTGEELTVKL